ncbi:PAS domain-containing serine/threonine-protein kinase [Bienertia sinuspersici]
MCPAHSTLQPCLHSLVHSSILHTTLFRFIAAVQLDNLLTGGLLLLPCPCYIELGLILRAFNLAAICLQVSGFQGLVFRV